MDKKFALQIVILSLTGHASIVMAQSTGTFSVTGSMRAARASHSATLLPNGKVLITGGQVIRGTVIDVLSSAELYDPAAGTFTPAGQLSVGRVGHAATLLSTGQVLITGGFDDHFHVLASAELYEPLTATFTQAGHMTTARAAHTSTLLNNGQVLITGGASDVAPSTASAEIYEPLAGRFTRIGNMTAARIGHLATLLSDGNVLIDGLRPGFLSAEIYEPPAGTFRPAGATAYLPYDLVALPASATLLPNGKVLFNLYEWDDSSEAAALYEPSTGTFSATGNATTERSTQTSTLLGDGTVLIAGLNYSSSFPNPASHADLYDWTTGAFSATANMTVGRIGHTATLLPDGTVLLAGGSMWSGITDLGRPFVEIAGAEIFRPPTLVLAPVLLSVSRKGGEQAAILHGGTHQLVSPDNPAVTGEALEIYATGLIDGGVIPPQVAIAGRMAEVLWFGNTAGFVGLNQVNVRVPSGVSGSAVPVRLNYLARPSNEVTIFVR